MRLMPAVNGDSLQRMWRRLSRLPGGQWMFSFMLGMAAPYTGSIGARVVELRPGYARVTLRDRRKVRNHLSSIHAVALVNLAEAASGLAMMCGLPTDMRGILVGFSIDYVKKARGTLTAECTAPAPEPGVRKEYELEAVVRDEAGDIVATGRPRWLIGPMTPKSGGEAQKGT
jgi:acyl-coenzyme A thioesterase PaaI-like protein